MRLLSKKKDPHDRLIGTIGLTGTIALTGTRGRQQKNFGEGVQGVARGSLGGVPIAG